MVWSGTSAAHPHLGGRAPFISSFACLGILAFARFLDLRVHDGPDRSAVVPEIGPAGARCAIGRTL